MTRINTPNPPAPYESVSVSVSDPSDRPSTPTNRLFSPSSLGTLSPPPLGHARTPASTESPPPPLYACLFPPSHHPQQQGSLQRRPSSVKYPPEWAQAQFDWHARGPRSFFDRTALFTAPADDASTSVMNWYGLEDRRYVGTYADGTTQTGDGDAGPGGRGEEDLFKRMEEVEMQRAAEGVKRRVLEAKVRVLEREVNTLRVKNKVLEACLRESVKTTPKPVSGEEVNGDGAGKNEGGYGEERGKKEDYVTSYVIGYVEDESDREYRNSIHTPTSLSPTSPREPRSSGGHGVNETATGDSGRKGGRTWDAPNGDWGEAQRERAARNQASLASRHAAQEAEIPPEDYHGTERNRRVRFAPRKERVDGRSKSYGDASGGDNDGDKDEDGEDEGTLRERRAAPEPGRDGPLSTGRYSLNDLVRAFLDERPLGEAEGG